MTPLSVIICSHNPRPAALQATLAALRLQTLPVRQWELLLIDNASATPLADRFDCRWHPQGRQVTETRLGLTHARLRGIAEAAGDILVFVDDDNVLAPDYLENVLAVGLRHKSLGAWGGRVELQFESEPAAWTRRYWHFLARRDVDCDEMICSTAMTGPFPVGAGMCLRKEVCAYYALQVASSPVRRALGRVGENLTSAEDTDLILTACDLGLQRGLVNCLHLFHLIPPERLTEAYLLRLAEGISFSSQVLAMSRSSMSAPPPTNWWWWLKFGCDCLLKRGYKRRFYLAEKRAQRRARKLFESWPAGESHPPPP